MYCPINTQGELTGVHSTAAVHSLAERESSCQRMNGSFSGSLFILRQPVHSSAACPFSGTERESCRRMNGLFSGSRFILEQPVGSLAGEVRSRSGTLPIFCPAFYKLKLWTFFKLRRGRCSSLEAHWLLVPGDHSSNPGGGEYCSSFVFES